MFSLPTPIIREFLAKCGFATGVLSFALGLLLVFTGLPCGGEAFAQPFRDADAGVEPPISQVLDDDMVEWVEIAAQRARAIRESLLRAEVDLARVIPSCWLLVAVQRWTGQCPPGNRAPPFPPSRSPPPLG